MPWSLKYSAIDVAVNAPFNLTNGGLSEVAHTTTDFFIPSGPRSLSIKSKTSLPLSPISAITLTSASAVFAIIPKVVLLPTPLPANIPTLWPSPQVINPSIALIPVGIIFLILFLFIGSGGLLNILYLSPPVTTLSSIGAPNASITFPNNSSLHLTLQGFPLATTLQPGPIPTNSFKGIRIISFSLKPTTSQSMGLLLWLYIVHNSPTAAFNPSTSIVSPITFLTFPSDIYGVISFIFLSVLLKSIEIIFPPIVILL